MNGFFIQLLGFIAFLFIEISVQKDKRSFTLISQLIAGVFFTAHFILLGAWTGAAMNIIAIFRAYIFNLTESKNYLNNKIVMYLFIILFWIGGLLTWEGYISIFPSISLTLECFALWSKKTRIIRWLLIYSTPFLMTYHKIVGSYAGIATESFMGISILIAIIRFDVLKSRNNSTT